MFSTHLRAFKHKFTSGLPLMSPSVESKGNWIARLIGLV